MFLFHPVNQSKNMKIQNCYFKKKYDNLYTSLNKQTISIFNVEKDI